MEDKKAYDLMVAARSQLLMTNPFFGCLILHLKLVEVMNPYFVSTMATDGTHLFYHPPFVHKTTERHRVGIVAHEGYHCARQHHVRMGSRDLSDWNIACDHIINLDLLKAQFALPDWVYKDPQYDGMSPEEVYVLLKRDKKKQQDQNKQGSGQGGEKQDGKGQAGNGKDKGDNRGTDAAGNKVPIGGRCDDPGGMGGVIVPANAGNPEAIEQERVKWEIIARQAVAVAKAQNAGVVPGYLERLVAELDKPKVDWENVLRRFVDESIVRRSSWSDPNRRHLYRGIILPGASKAVNVRQLISVVDTSGSITDELLKKYTSELAAILDEQLCDELVIIYADAAVKNVDVFERGDEIRINAKGGGGTNFRPVFNLIKDQYEDANLILFFTDLCSVDFGDDPGKPVLWLCYENSQHIERWREKVPFGEITQVDQ